MVLAGGVDLAVRELDGDVAGAWVAAAVVDANELDDAAPGSTQCGDGAHPATATVSNEKHSDLHPFLKRRLPTVWGMREA